MKRMSQLVTALSRLKPEFIVKEHLRKDCSVYLRATFKDGSHLHFNKDYGIGTWEEQNALASLWKDRQEIAHWYGKFESIAPQVVSDLTKMLA